MMQSRSDSAYAQELACGTAQRTEDEYIAEAAEATSTLSQLADKGDQHDITEVAARLEHEDWPVRVGWLYSLSAGGEQ